MSGTCRVCYFYRDAGNYRFYGEFFVGGTLELGDLQPFLLHSQYFVPERIGIPSLVPQTKNEDDHQLHEFDSIEACDPAVYTISAEMLIDSVKRANRKGWFHGVQSLG